MLDRRYRATGPRGARSLSKLSRELGGVNRGTLSAVIHGRREATPQILRALGLPIPRKLLADACLTCGKVHLRRSCPSARKASIGQPRRNWLGLALTLAGVLAHVAIATDGESSSSEARP